MGLAYHLGVKNGTVTEGVTNGDTSKNWIQNQSYYLDDDFEVSIDTSDELYEKPEHFMKNMSPSEIQNEIDQEVDKIECSLTRNFSKKGQADGKLEEKGFLSRTFKK